MSDQKDLSAIIQECLTNNQQAQAQLYRELYGLAMHTAMRYSRDEDDAANIVALAFVKMFRSLHSFNSTKGSIQGWLKKIVINEALDFLKANQKFGRYEELEATAVSIVDNELTDNLSAAELLELIRMLPPATQAVFNLFVIEGYSHKEIAAIAGISEGTSKWHLSNARKYLQTEIINLNSA